MRKVHGLAFALVVLFISPLCGCIIPTGYRTSHLIVARRFDGASNLEDAIDQKTIRSVGFLTFSPEGPEWDYTLSARYEYFYDKMGGIPIRLKFLDTADSVQWWPIAPVAGTNRWVALGDARDPKLIIRPEHYSSTRLLVFNSNAVVLNRALTTYGGLLQLQPDNRHVVNWTADGRYEIYDLLDLKIVPDPYREAGPGLRVKVISSNVPVPSGEPLRLKIELTTTGTTPVALAQDQFSIGRPGTWELNPIFANDVPKVITISPGQPLTVELSVSFNARWRPAETQHFAVRLNIHPRVRQFDYQWLTYTASDFFDFDRQ